MNGVDGVVLVVIQITDDPSAEQTAPLRSTHVRSEDVSRALIQQGGGRGWGRQLQQQHDGVVVVEERGTPAGLRQALRETRRERGRAAPRRRLNRVFGSPKPQVYIGGGEGLRPHLGFHP